jgi:hypothetical protein
MMEQQRLTAAADFVPETGAIDDDVGQGFLRGWV